MSVIVRAFINHLQEAPTSPSFLTQKERQMITAAIHEYPELGGSPKLPKKERALTIIGQALDACGFYLDMVSGDTIRGSKGSRALPFGRKPANPEAEDGVIIENSAVIFVWEDLAPTPSGEGASFVPSTGSFEIICYLS